MDKSEALKHIEKTYRLIPMSDITDEARELARRWYDGVSELNDIREKHKLASDIMNYSSQHAIEFQEWLSEMTTTVKEEKITLYRYCDNMNEWGNYTLADIYQEFEEHLKRK